MSEKNMYLRNGVWLLQAAIRGKLYRRSLHSSDVKIARKERDKLIEKIKSAVWRGDRVVSWADGCAEWVSHELGQISPATAKRYAVSLSQANPYFRKVSIDAIDGNMVAEFISARRKSGAKPATIRRDLTAISRVLEYAEAMGWREGNPTLSKRKILKERRDPIQLPKHDEIYLMIENSSVYFGRLIQAAWLTGCRQNELVLAKWSGFNPNNGTLEVIGKGNKRRVISLEPPALAQFKVLPRLGEYIFPKSDGTPFRMAASDFTHIRRFVRAKMAKEGRDFTGFRFHDLRHLYAVEALKNGISIYDLQKHMGHSSIKVTEMYLEFLTPDEHKSAKDGAIAVTYAQKDTH